MNLYFYALTAHFGKWLAFGRRRRTVRRWQVESSLIYGQVKKSYQRRKLVRVTHVMRLGTEEALKAALQGMGFSGRLNTAFIERVNLTVRHGIAARTRGQIGGATLQAAHTGDGSWENQPTMDDARGAFLPIIAGIRLRGIEARRGCRVVSRGDW